MQVRLDNIDTLAWDKMNNLIPAIIQHAHTGSVLMQGYMDQNALERTLQQNLATFYSRSKQRLWQKGETSGNTLAVQCIVTDCDKDSLLVLAIPNGPTCHLGTDSCFSEQTMHQQNFLSYLEHVIQSRKNDSPDTSYTASLLAQGSKRCAQKVGEEGVEVALAAATHDRAELLNECADLLYHTLVLLTQQNVDLKDVMKVLQSRHQP
ncbi:bifunctional phosphoribosyl-AMP cyclohydrolase/phosphoribosyl-ATP diphosphatase HisIE [Thalassotalea ponticola]|uniref:bifunctional phosphoribosyl-AMP cyclohydrolase/phosphoribosyl-ATP diphosphatase HisIE n=1 Tax=Thalassotalea ponticola TaxID=1523392 RepID=UPI0025B53D02|nr:bifunctional phosphoribosyl-AMP cyclohydrolase/phosphoribosyl-ATP diphosphatase HisIE [Thalassotalea ponticola]MDN3651306.1 bifunctional phosphoribosyl-AMP cyclohydrolase/phosphoribosyl-ATP diphosphatase HisIE [Thalassotalea ponticola]